jgi:hypothetical protein
MDTTDKQRHKRAVNPNSLKNLRPQKAGMPSINPAGRPKKADCLISCIKSELEKISINGTETNEQLIAGVLVKKAQQGDLKAIEILMSYTVSKPKQDIGVGNAEDGGVTINVISRIPRPSVTTEQANPDNCANEDKS